MIYEYEVERNGNNDWKKCMLVASLIATACDINRRKGLALAAYNKPMYILEARRILLKIPLTLRIFWPNKISNNELYAKSKTSKTEMARTSNQTTGTYRKISNISGTKSPNLNVSRLVLQLSLPNPMKSGVKSIMKMQLEQRRQAMLQLHLSDRRFQYLLRCGLY